MPASATGFTGQGTTSITVQYPAAAVSGAVSVRALNNCGISSIRSKSISLPACAAGKVSSDISYEKVTAEKSSQDIFEVTVYPNPSINDFAVKVNSSGKGEIKIRILDAQGRVCKILMMPPNVIRTLGSDLKAGFYILEATGNDKIISMRLVKL